MKVRERIARKVWYRTLLTMWSLIDSIRIATITGGFRELGTDGLTDEEAQWLEEFDDHLKRNNERLRRFAWRLKNESQ